MYKKGEWYILCTYFADTLSNLYWQCTRRGTIYKLLTCNYCNQYIQCCFFPINHQNCIKKVLHNKQNMYYKLYNNGNSTFSVSIFLIHCSTFGMKFLFNTSIVIIIQDILSLTRQRSSSSRSSPLQDLQFHSVPQNVTQSAVPDPGPVPDPSHILDECLYNHENNFTT